MVFQVVVPEQIEARKRSIQERLNRGIPDDISQPMFSASNIHFELAGETGLVEAIDNNLHLLKVHVPYHESDHVLNIAYNTMCEGRCLEDIELRRNDETFLDALGTERIPDPTTEGDFCRARVKRVFTSFADSPTHFETRLEEEI